VGASLVTRVCACPCQEPLVGRRESVKYIDHTHAQRAYRARLKESLVSAGLPASLSLNLVKTTTSTQNHNGDGYRAVSARRSGLQVSYRKAVLALALNYQREGKPWLHTMAKAERVLQEALSDRQRAQLHAREQKPTERKAA
jgi:hypothetical protein